MIEVRTLPVYLDGNLVGELVQNQHGTLSFTYHEGYPTTATPLSVSMPITGARTYRGAVVGHYFAGLLPDNPATLRAWGMRYGASWRNPFALLRYQGKDTAGALQILPSGEPPPDAGPRDESVRVLTPTELAQALQHADELTRMVDTGRWSLAGAQAKVALFRNPDGQWAVPLDSTPTTHILKPAIRDLKSHALNEMLSQRAASLCGLVAASGWVEQLDGIGHVLVSQRYDRMKRAGYWHRIHQEDFCQALSVAPDQKYQQEGGPGVAQMAQVLDLICDVSERDRSTRRLLAALAFNVAIGGTDAHAKNYSLLLQGSKVTLAPLYDLASYWPNLRPGELPTSAMRIGKHYRFDQIGTDDWEKTGRKLHIPPDEAVEIVRGIQARCKDAYHQAFSELPSALRSQGGQLVDAIIPRIPHIVGTPGLGRPSSPPLALEQPAPSPSRSADIWISGHQRSGKPVSGHWRRRQERAEPT